MLTLLLIAGGLALGYLTGRTAPLSRASLWAWRQIDYRHVTRTSWRWWAAQPVLAWEIAILLAAKPRQALRWWRSCETRNDPPPRGPVPVRADPWPPEPEEQP
ncbi:hypothetical protein [Streptomyces goshikiensis]|uniref:hypothetical protein n=1 Tax=Streptomyces goshikiensis TaxID=1942 RepID=UPI0036B84850